ncbi:hypothetical protein GCM10027422_28960 [Hymenobacter arcticus]
MHLGLLGRGRKWGGEGEEEKEGRGGWHRIVLKSGQEGVGQLTGKVTAVSGLVPRSGYPRRSAGEAGRPVDA